jgi:hypothetical protein
MLFPVIDLDFDYGHRRASALYHGKPLEYSWMETNTSSGVNLPLRMHRNGWWRSITPAVKYSMTWLDMDQDSPLEFRTDEFTTLEYKIYASNQTRAAERELFPRWAQSVELNYRHGSRKPDSAGNITATEASLYFPGMLRHHSINLYAGYQLRDEGNYAYSGYVNYPRGLDAHYDTELFSISASYALPLLHPDLSLGPVAYIKRLKARFYYDHATGITGSTRQDYASVTADLTAYMHILRFVAPFELGLRTSYDTSSREFVFNFLYSINFSDL